MSQYYNWHPFDTSVLHLITYKSTSDLPINCKYDLRLFSIHSYWNGFSCLVIASLLLFTLNTIKQTRNTRIDNSIWKVSSKTLLFFVCFINNPNANTWFETNRLDDKTIFITNSYFTKYKQITFWFDISAIKFHKLVIITLFVHPIHCIYSIDDLIYVEFFG